ncbi:MAG: hypothetical protein R6U66_11305 [Bacteroidales bacterium]
MSRILYILRWVKVSLKRIDTRFTTFLLFVLFATVFWFLIKLEEEFTTEIEYPIRFANLPEDKVLVGELPESFSLNITAHGFNLLKYKFSNAVIPFTIDFNDYPLKLSRSSSNFFILTEDIRKNIEKQLSNEVSVQKIRPDSLFFDFDERSYKLVPVIGRHEIQLAQQYMFEGKPQLTPDSVEVSGPLSLLDTLQAVYTQPKVFTNVNTQLDKELKLEPLKQLDLAQEQVRLTAEVVQFTEASVQLPIETRNVPDSLRLITFRKDAVVRCRVSFENYPKIISALFEVVVDYNDIREHPQQLPLYVRKAPEYTRSVRVEPQAVDYLIEKVE